MIRMSHFQIEHLNKFIDNSTCYSLRGAKLAQTELMKDFRTECLKNY